MKLTDVVPVEGDYGVLENLAMITNGVYNMSVYANEKEAEKSGRYLFYNKTYEALKNERLYNLLPSQTAQAVLQKHDGGLRSYIALRKSDPRARRPGYRPKRTAFVVPWKSQQFKIFGEIANLTLAEEYKKEKGVDALVVRLVGFKQRGEAKYMELYKWGGRWMASVVQEVEVPKTRKPERFLRVDLGIRNLAAVYDDANEKSWLYKGGAVNSVVRYRNKEVGKMRTVLPKGVHTSRAIRKTSERLTRQTHHIVHAFTEQLVEKAKREGVGILVGNPNGIRRRVKGSKKTNQLVHSWLFAMMLFQLKYKCKLNGVYFKAVDERNTSKRCALCHRIHKGGRIRRGMYRCKLYGIAYNADSGAAYNMGNKKYRRVQSGSERIGVVDALARPAVMHWNQQSWVRA